MCKCSEDLTNDGRNISLPIFNCEAIKSFSGDWVLIKINNCEKDFKYFDIFREGDFLEQNVDTSEADKIASYHIKFKIRVVDMDDLELDIFDIEAVSFFKNTQEKEKYKKDIKEVYANYSNADNLCEIKELQYEIDNNIKQIEKMKIKQSAIRSCT